MYPRTIIGLIVVLLLAGCLTGSFGGPSGQEGPVLVDVENGHDVTYTFDVWVAEGELNNNEVVIRMKHDEDDSASPGQGLSTYNFTEESGYPTAIELPENSSRLHGRYTLEPGENETTSISDFETGSTVVVVVSREGRVVSLVAAHCGGNLVGLEVTMFYYGTSSGYGCYGGDSW